VLEVSSGSAAGVLGGWEAVVTSVDGLGVSDSLLLPHAVSDASAKVEINRVYNVFFIVAPPCKIVFHKMILL